MLTRTQKLEQVAELKEKFGKATCVYVVDYCGIDVESVNRLRRRIRTEGAGDFEYQVIKNAVLRVTKSNFQQDKLANASPPVLA